MSQQQNVFLLHGRSECAIGQVVDVVCDLVASVLELTQSRMAIFSLRKRVPQLSERLADQRALMTEELIEAMLSRDQAQLHALNTLAKGKAAEDWRHCRGPREGPRTLSGQDRLAARGHTLEGGQSEVLDGLW